MSMHLRKASLALSLLLLTGCGEAEERPTPEVDPPLREVSTSCVWEDITFNAITPVCAFEAGDTLNVYPYNDADRVITVRKAYISDNNFWDTISKKYVGTGNYRDYNDFYVITYDSGVSMGYVPLDNEYAYFVESDLPSSYVIACARELCK